MESGPFAIGRPVAAAPGNAFRDAQAGVFKRLSGFFNAVISGRDRNGRRGVGRVRRERSPGVGAPGGGRRAAGSRRWPSTPSISSPSIWRTTEPRRLKDSTIFSENAAMNTIFRKDLIIFPCHGLRTRARRHPASARRRCILEPVRPPRARAARLQARRPGRRSRHHRAMVMTHGGLIVHTGATTGLGALTRVGSILTTRLSGGYRGLQRHGHDSVFR